MIDGRLNPDCACMRCQVIADDVERCCSAHNASLCHVCYRLTHFVEICDCGMCAGAAAVQS